MRGDFWAGTTARIVPNKSPEMSSSRRFPFTNERPETKFMSTCLYLVSFCEIVTLSTNFKIGIKINSSNEISSQSTSLNFCLLQKFCNKKKSQACHSKCHVLLRMSLTIVHKHKILLSYSWNEITFICTVCMKRRMHFYFSVIVQTNVTLVSREWRIEGENWLFISCIGLKLFYWDTVVKSKCILITSFLC